MSELISIIIPVYKVEKYLERCVHSVLEQTYSNIEVVLVDDGSPDNCGYICENLAKQDKRVKVYHKSNGGLSDARNYGVERASGNYIAFVDSDDFLASNYIEYLYNLIKKYDADISCCCMIETDGNRAEYGKNATMSGEIILTGKEACRELFGSLYLILVTACGKLYKKDLVDMNPFPVGRIHEDEATTCKYYYNSQRVVVGNKCLYAYYQNPKSITHDRGSYINIDQIWGLNHRAEYFESKNEVFLAKCAWEMLMNYYINDSMQNNGRCDVFIKDYAKGKSLFSGTKRRLVLYNVSPKLYKKYMKLKTCLLMLKNRNK